MSAPVGNKFAIGNHGGRPPIYDDPQKLTAKIIEYFDWIEGEQEEVMVKSKQKDEEGNNVEITKKEKHWIRYPEDPTITGLCLFLGFSSKGTLYEYAKKKEFSDSIKRALLIVENNYEQKLNRDRCTGIIFALKNMGWEDRQKVETKSGPVEVKGISQEEIDEMLEE